MEISLENLCVADVWLKGLRVTKLQNGLVT